MPTPRSRLPEEFSWLSPAARPSPDEVLTYAHLINAAENQPLERLESCLREAELQLWSWRSMPPPLSPRPYRRARPKRPESARRASVA